MTAIDFINNATRVEGSEDLKVWIDVWGWFIESPFGSC